MDGLPVTCPARTVVDVARRGPLEYGVAAADRALALGIDPDELSAQVEQWPHRPGIRRARLAVGFADSLSESFGESFSRLVIWRIGLPTPTLQYVVDVRGVRYRSDFAWPEYNVLGEFDGRVKYSQVLDRRTAAEVVLAEKRREQHLHSVGWDVIRWGMDELRNPHQLSALLEPALRRGAKT